MNNPPLTDLSLSPFALFSDWMREAETAGEKSPEAMSVATATLDGMPSVRTLLLKGYDENGFVFYTNGNSRQGREMAENPRAALLFYWKTLERQIRIEGSLSRLTGRQTDDYFHSRPRISQLGALASEQSAPLADRSILENRLQEISRRYPEPDIVPRPPEWSGYRLTPERFEFWQAFPYRLHDRAEWRKSPAPENGQETAQWIRTRLYP